MEPNLLVGIVCVILSPILYGTTFVPMKRFEGGDGIFVQWMMCVGQLLPGLLVLWLYNFPPIYPLAMLGGVFYAIANSFAVFIMDGIGMTVAGLLWNSTCCVVGWGVARFGLFGTRQEEPNSPTINVIGVITVLIGGALFTLVRNTPIKMRPHPYLPRNPSKKLPEVDEDDEARTKFVRRIVCIALALGLGLLFGNLLTPISIMINNSEEWGVPSTIEPYLFSHFFGGFVTSTFIFVVYGLVSKNTPVINPEIALPSMLSGVIYGSAVVLFFLSNQHLSQVIAFPVVAMTPGIISSLWGILLFKEIQGKQNLIMLAVAYCITLTGVMLIALSKI